MNIDFFKKVKEMREAQNRYFRDRSQKNLNAAKFLERAIDGMIKDFEQPNLFK